MHTTWASLVAVVVGFLAVVVNGGHNDLLEWFFDGIGTGINNVCGVVVTVCDGGGGSSNVGEMLLVLLFVMMLMLLGKSMAPWIRGSTPDHKVSSLILNCTQLSLLGQDTLPHIVLVHSAGKSELYL